MDGVELHYHHDVDVLIALSDSNLQDFTARVMQHVERSLLHSRFDVQSSPFVMVKGSDEKIRYLMKRTVIWYFYLVTQTSRSILKRLIVTQVEKRTNRIGY